MIFLSLGLLGLFTGCFISATLIPFPSEALLIGSFELDYPVWICLSVATVGNVLGSCTNYYIGFFASNEKLVKKFKLNRERLAWWQKKFSRSGIFLGLISWVPFLGDPMVVALGFFKVRFCRNPRIRIVSFLTFIRRICHFLYLQHL